MEVWPGHESRYRYTGAATATCRSSADRNRVRCLRNRSRHPGSSTCSGRVFTNGPQRTPQVDQFRSVEVQGDHGGAARRRAATDDEEIVVPGKMPRPPLAARVEERHDAPCLGIAAVRLIIFVTVTPRTGPDKFGKRVASPLHARKNVFADKRGTRVARGMLAVFVAVPRTVAHLAADGPWDRFTHHPRHLPR